MMINLNQLAAQCEANSERWFPHLHDPEITSDGERLKHVTLGLVEEIAELSEVVWQPTGADRFPGEAADVAVYALNIAAAANSDLDEAMGEVSAISYHSDPVTHLRKIGWLGGRIAGIVKKRTGYRAGQAAHSEPQDLSVLLAEVLFRLQLVASQHGVNLPLAIEEKTAICEERWG